MLIHLNCEMYEQISKYAVSDNTLIKDLTENREYK